MFLSLSIYIMLTIITVNLNSIAVGIEEHHHAWMTGIDVVVGF